MTNRPHIRLYPNVQARLIIPFLTVSIITAGIGVFIVTRLVVGSIQERVNNQLIDSARAATNSIVDFEREQLATLRIMVFTEGIAPALVARDTASLTAWLQPLAANAALDELLVFDQHGQTLLRLERDTDQNDAHYRTLPVINIGHWPGVRQALSGIHDDQGDKFVDIIDGQRLYISAPVVNDEMVGGIAIGIDLTRLVQLVSEQSLSGVALYAPDGTVWAHSFRMVADEALALDVVQAGLLALQVRSESPMTDWTLHDEPYQALFSPFRLRDSDYGLLAVGLPSHFIVERSGTSRDIFGILFATLFVTVGVLGVITARTIINPVTRLVETTRAIRGGDFSRRVRLQTPDELGELGRSFDHMTNQLVRQNQKINELYIQQLQETTRLDAVLKSIADPVMVSNSNREILLKNQAAQALLGRMSSNAVLRRQIRLLVLHPELILTPRTTQLEDRHYSVLATPVHLPDGNLMGHIILFRDITSLIEAEHLKDELMMQMSHELRTPLAAIRGYLELVQMLEAANLSEQGQEFVGGAHEHLGILERLITQVEDVSAVLADRLQLDQEACNLTQLLQGQAAAWYGLMQTREITLATYVPEAEIWVTGDERRLSQVLDHLLRNAHSYTLPGGTVEIQVALQANTVMIYIADTGVGIADHEIDRVFERMYRGESAAAGDTDSSGLGLGLYLARYIVEAHGGQLMLDSKVDQGTIVKLGLPLREMVWSNERVGEDRELVTQ